MLLIAAYPCLGKTTIANQNKERMFDREFCESRSRLGMNEGQNLRFVRACCDIIQMQYEANHYDVMFITEDEEILEELGKRGIRPILVFPNAFNDEHMIEYKESVIKRSGKEWWNRVLADEIRGLKGRINKYRDLGYDVRLTYPQKPYISDVVELGV